MLKLSQDLLDLLHQPSTCYVATLMPDGSPQLTQTWVDTDGDHLVINIVEGSVKHRNVLRDPHVALAVADPADPRRYVQVRGRVVEATTEGSADHIEALSLKYTGAPYSWYGGRNQVRVIVKIEASSINAPF